MLSREREETPTRAREETPEQMSVRTPVRARSRNFEEMALRAPLRTRRNFDEMPPWSPVRNLDEMFASTLMRNLGEIPPLPSVRVPIQVPPRHLEPITHQQIVFTNEYWIDNPENIVYTEFKKAKLSPCSTCKRTINWSIAHIIPSTVPEGLRDYEGLSCKTTSIWVFASNSHKGKHVCSSRCCRTHGCYLCEYRFLKNACKLAYAHIKHPLETIQDEEKDVLLALAASMMK